MGDLVLEGLVLFVLLDQVELDLQVVDLEFACSLLRRLIGCWKLALAMVAPSSGSRAS